jgi:hypothetical protein
MSVDVVSLAFTPESPVAGLRHLCGADEQLVDRQDTAFAIHLLNRLLVDEPGLTLKPGAAATLTAADRDRLLAAVYRRAYGPRIASTLTCPACARPFDLDFNLPDLVASLQPAPEPALEPHNGSYAFTLADARRFRLPTGADELAVSHLPPAAAERELLRRCALSGSPTTDPAAVQAAMAAVAPVIDVEMDARCPECGQSQPVHFDIQSYLLAALAAEQPRLAVEIHQLARAYHWSLPEILGLSRVQRRAFVALIEQETVSK